MSFFFFNSLDIISTWLFLVSSQLYQDQDYPQKWVFVKYKTDLILLAHTTTSERMSETLFIKMFYKRKYIHLSKPCWTAETAATSYSKTHSSTLTTVYSSVSGQLVVRCHSYSTNHKPTGLKDPQNTTKYPKT